MLTDILYKHIFTVYILQPEGASDRLQYIYMHTYNAIKASAVININRILWLF